MTRNYLARLCRLSLSLAAARAPVSAKRDLRIDCARSQPLINEQAVVGLDRTPSG